MLYYDHVQCMFYAEIKHNCMKIINKWQNVSRNNCIYNTIPLAMIQKRNETAVCECMNVIMLHMQYI